MKQYKADFVTDIILRICKSIMLIGITIAALNFSFTYSHIDLERDRLEKDLMMEQLKTYEYDKDLRAIELGGY